MPLFLCYKGGRVDPRMTVKKEGRRCRDDAVHQLRDDAVHQLRGERQFRYASQSESEVRGGVSCGSPLDGWSVA